MKFGIEAGANLPPYGDAHHIKVMIVRPYLQTQTASHDRHCRIDQCDGLIREGQNLGCSPTIIFGGWVNE
jgi:hypothetical protein